MMKHAGPDALENLESLLEALRERRALVERTPGSFYLRSTAFLHFHEDPAGLFADLKEEPPGFTRYRVTTKPEQRELLARVERCLKGRESGSGKKGQ
jgi:hypothetical protein